MVRTYEPFVIEVDELEGGAFPVEAEFRGTSWSGSIPASLPLLTGQEVRQALTWLERGFIDRDYAQDFGERLFRTLFPNPIREGFRLAYERVAPAGMAFWPARPRHRWCVTFAVRRFRTSLRRKVPCAFSSSPPRLQAIHR
jgi:hypothetical protein